MGGMLHYKLTDWGFISSVIEPRLYFYSQHERLLVLYVVVDDVAFASNDHSLMEYFNSKIQAVLEVQLYINLT